MLPQGLMPQPQVYGRVEGAVLKGVSNETNWSLVHMRYIKDKEIAGADL